jgi:hypothetical protein
LGKEKRINNAWKRQTSDPATAPNSLNLSNDTNRETVTSLIKKSLDNLIQPRYDTMTETKETAMTRKPIQCVLLNANPHKTAHFWDVASERFRGTFCECETYERRSGYDGYIWRADLWDAGKKDKRDL